jgi:hypothetical protein
VLTGFLSHAGVKYLRKAIEYDQQARSGTIAETVRFWLELIAERGQPMKNASKQLADEYRRLGGNRVAVIDDNLGSSRDWEGDPPEAEKFWNEKIATLSDRERRDVETFLPSLNDETDEPGTR